MKCKSPVRHANEQLLPPRGVEITTLAAPPPPPLHRPRHDLRVTTCRAHPSPRVWVECWTSGTRWLIVKVEHSAVCLDWILRRIKRKGKWLCHQMEPSFHVFCDTRVEYYHFQLIVKSFVPSMNNKIRNLIKYDYNNIRQKHINFLANLYNFTQILI